MVLDMQAKTVLKRGSLRVKRAINEAYVCFSKRWYNLPHHK